MDTSSITRLSGFASGLDTDSIVKKLMDAEKIPLNKLKQNQQKDLWLSDSYRQWNKDLYSFQSDTLFNMKLSSSYNTFDVSSTMENSVSGKGTPIALTGSYSVSVKQLAQSASFTGSNLQIDSTKTLGDQGKLSADTAFSISVYNDPNNPSMAQTANISISKSDTISAVVSKINSATDASGKSLGLQTIYDSNLQQFMVKTKATGAYTKIEITDNGTPDSQNLLNNTLGIGTGIHTGQNADILFNGQEITTIASNTTTIMGINLTLKSPTLDASGNITTSTITVSQNIDDEVKNIKDFVNKYNDLLDRLNKANEEPVYKDYQPLTDDQRSGMSDKQIEQWEDKAKSGLLHGDSIIRGLIDKVRNTMTTIVGNGSTYNSLSSIGISSYSYQDKGKLYVDETKLREAIQADPDGVKNLFSQVGDTSKGTNGLVRRLSDDVAQGIKDLTAKAGYTGFSQYDQSVIGKLLTGIQTDITTQNNRLTQIEDRYYKQFAAMETAINKFNSQGSWLSQQMNSGQ